jgi:isopenicillin N synthase-like dioxygenase
VVDVDYSDLVAGKDLGHSIEEAYVFDGLGLLTVSNVPNVLEKRKDLLMLAREYALLPDQIKKKSEATAETFYSFGWSHGKELFNGEPDVSKGSFYANPQHDVVTEDAALIKKFPSYCSPNVWPTEDLPALRDSFMTMGGLVCDVGQLLLSQCDRYVESQSPAFQQGSLGGMLARSRVSKARLLHYFPLDDVSEKAKAKADSWCGWHNDHGAITGLTSNLFLDECGKEVAKPDPEAGLLIQSRSGKTIQAGFRPDQLAFQIGEAAMVLSGGLLMATPHSVRAAYGEAARGVSRETFAVFMQPMYDESLDIPADRTEDQTQSGTNANHLPPGIPPLMSRWNNGLDFGTFTNQTISGYH